MRVDKEQTDRIVSDSEKNRIQQSLKVFARVIAVAAAVFVLLARDGVGPSYLDSIGKALFWTGIVFVPLFGLNQDVLHMTAGKLTAMVLSALQFILIFYFFGRLRELTFVTLTPLCIGQFVIFAVPLLLIRKRNSGVWY